MQGLLDLDIYCSLCSQAWESESVLQIYIDESEVQKQCIGAFQKAELSTILMFLQSMPITKEPEIAKTGRDLSDSASKPVILASSLSSNMSTEASYYFGSLYKNCHPCVACLTCNMSD